MRSERGFVFADVDEDIRVDALALEILHPPRLGSAVRFGLQKTFNRC
jgi:hypothetical protein